MKIWNEQAADHSAKLKIVGTFKNTQDAEEVVRKVNGLLELVAQELPKPENQSYAPKVHDYIMENNFFLSPAAVDLADVLDQIENTNNQIIIETDELDIQLFVESFINGGGKIEIMSKHNE